MADYGIYHVHSAIACAIEDRKRMVAFWQDNGNTALAESAANDLKRFQQIQTDLTNGSLVVKEVLPTTDPFRDAERRLTDVTYESRKSRKYPER